MTWYGARAYCEWMESRLPTEAEWEYAAKGPDGLVYPWGNEFLADSVVYDVNSNNHAWDVGSMPAGVSWVGAYNMGGNVREWLNDWYLSDYYETLDDGEVNPQGPGSGEYRVLRSGSWLNEVSEARAANRNGHLPAESYGNNGFRCARSYTD